MNGRFENSAVPDLEGDGYRVGAGAEFAPFTRVYLKAEYRFSDYGREVRGQHLAGAVGLRF